MRQKIVRKPLGLKQKLKNIIQKLYLWRSPEVRFQRSHGDPRCGAPILLVLLFVLSIAIPLFVAQVSVSTPIVQTQPNTLQLVELGRKLYQARQFEEAATVWQQATEAFAAGGDRLNQAMALSNLSLTYQQLGQWNQAQSAIAQSLSFNVGEGRGAYFSNPTAIENILSRVTGSNLSEILGSLGVLGDANLFLINPNGIVFGPNARLEVGGLFVGSTADSLVFGNEFEFSATNPQAPPGRKIEVAFGVAIKKMLYFTLFR